MPTRPREKNQKKLYHEVKDKTIQAFQNAAPEQQALALNDIRYVVPNNKTELETIIEGLLLSVPPITKVELAKRLKIKNETVANRERKIVLALFQRMHILENK